MYASYYEVERAIGLVSNEVDAEIAMFREAMEYGDTPQTLVVLLCPMIMGDYDCRRILTDEGETYDVMRAAATAGVGGLSMQERREELLRRAPLLLRQNGKSLQDYNLPTPEEEGGGSELHREMRYRANRHEVMIERLNNVSMEGKCMICVPKHEAQLSLFSGLCTGHEARV